MQICCTKRLQDEMGLALQKAPEANDLFCWSAHLITVSRRKTVVVVNDCNRFGFVLYGLKAKDFKNFQELVLRGIRNCLKDEKIKDEIIEQYLKTAGELTFAKTRGPRYVARLNKACERVDIFNDRLNPNTLFQVIATRRMNNDFIKIHKGSDYQYPHELLIRDFEQLAGGPVIRCEAVDLIIKLNLDRNSAWRRIITPIDINFKQLHEVIQVAFDWKSHHLYDFNIFDQNGRCMLNVISELEEVYETRQECKMLLDSDVNLSEYAKHQYRIVYCYDYGDNWEHEIVINSIIADYDKNHPICLMSEGNAPPEDVGGVGGYEEFLAIMADPNHAEYEDTLQWAESQWYKAFDIDIANRRLKNVLRR